MNGIYSRKLGGLWSLCPRCGDRKENMAWVGEVREWKRGVCGKSHSSQGVGWRPALISPIIALYLNSKKKKDFIPTCGSWAELPEHGNRPVYGLVCFHRKEAWNFFINRCQYKMKLKFQMELFQITYGGSREATGPPLAWLRVNNTMQQARTGALEWVELDRSISHRHDIVGTPHVRTGGRLFGRHRIVDMESYICRLFIWEAK